VPPRLLATALDVTERTSIERLRDALIATASHELRTPLTSIVGFAQTLKERWELFDERQRLEFIEIIGNQGRRLSALVEDTLMQSRIDAKSVPQSSEPYPVERSIHDALVAAQVDDVEVVCDSALVALGSPEHLEQIVVNLVTNAIKYGQPPIRIVASRNGGGEVAIRVIDHGDGVEPEFRERMFERFTRGPKTDLLPGTGLGLSIVRGLAEADGGTVRYERSDAETSFIVVLPAWQQDGAGTDGQGSHGNGHAGGERLPRKRTTDGD
jgi:signal transduction histidine kinase